MRLLALLFLSTVVHAAPDTDLSWLAGNGTASDCPTLR